MKIRVAKKIFRAGYGVVVWDGGVRTWVGLPCPRHTVVQYDRACNRLWQWIGNYKEMT